LSAEAGNYAHHARNSEVKNEIHHNPRIPQEDKLREDNRQGNRDKAGKTMLDLQIIQMRQ